MYRQAEEQEKEFEKETICYICELPFTECPPIVERQGYGKDVEDIDKKKNNMRKVRDHDHLTGKYRGAAHSICNLNSKVPRFIPVFFHNLSGYDSHLFIKEFGVDKSEIRVIANGEESYISFSKVLRYEKFDLKTNRKVLENVELRFLDSFKFLPNSLDKLASNLNKEQCKHL